MSDFNSMFPDFASRCAQLQNILTPLAYIFLVGGMIAATISGHRSGAAYMRTFGRTIMLIVVLTFLVSWGNQITSLVDSTVKNTLGVDPTQVYNNYQHALQVHKAAEGQRSWWQKAFELRATLLEAILTGIFWFLGWIASAIVWWAYVLQTAILFIGYGLSPIFVGFLAFQSLHEVGKRYLLNLAGVMLWPLGWGVAGLVTQSVMTFMTDRSFLTTSMLGNEAYTFQNLIGIAFLGIWIIFSTIAAPVIMQNAIATGSSAASDMFSGAFGSARIAASNTGMTVVAAGTGTSGMGAVGAGIITAATAGESLGIAAMNGGSSGSTLIGSLVGMRPKNQNGGEGSNSFPRNDITGDKTVADMIRKTRNPYSSQ